MSDNLNHGHVDMVEEFKLRVASGKGDSYMLTVARDGESPARSIYFYADALTASEGYSAYQDWGFAKDYLTVELYEPTGRVHSKILHRPRGGECTFIRDDYHKAKDIFLAVKENVPIEEYNYLVYEFVKLFSKDNQRFAPERFLDDTRYTGETNDQH
jgi:hypothetical protein